MYKVTLIIQGAEDYTFYATDEDVEDNYQDMLVDACETANIDTSDVINVTTEYEEDEHEAPEHPYCKEPLQGYPCAICEMECCPNCDTYYLVVNETTGEYITDTEEIIKREGDLEGHVAHQHCAAEYTRID